MVKARKVNRLKTKTALKNNAVDPVTLQGLGTDALAPLEPEPKKKRRKRTVDTDEIVSGQLLVSRKAACKLLGNVSAITLMRMEEQDVLHPVRLNKLSATGKVYYRMAELRALAEVKE
jgi:hypothetical protein